MTLGRKDSAGPRGAGRRRLTHELEGGAAGILAGAVVGAAAGPPGIVTGTIVGAVIGTAAGATLDEAAQGRSERDRELDETIGVFRGSLGAGPAARKVSTEREEVAMNPGAPTATGHRRHRTAGQKKVLRRAASAPDGGDAFVDDFRAGFTPIRDGDAEAFGEEFVLAITSNDAIGELARDEVHPEELGGLVVDLEDPDAFDLADVI
jgi:hypothetical protein